MKKIAIIGTGVSGLTAAHMLSKKHDVHVYEASSIIGGHTATVDIEVPSGKYAIDTGFIVFNDWTYPNFIKLMNHLGVSSQASDMGFSVKAEENGLEYNGADFDRLFSQRKNIFNFNFCRMLTQIVRFNRDSLETLAEGYGDKTLGEYLLENNYSVTFRDLYIVPMGAAIWSASVAQIIDFPIQYFVRFFKNHGMLSVNHRPVWRVIQKGSRSYLEPLIESFKNKIQTSAPVEAVYRKEDRAWIKVVGREPESFDDVIIASHADQTLKMLKDATPLEKELLNTFPYQPNETVLHTDTTVLPKNMKAWAAWNYFVPKHKLDRVAVSYNMNILQGISAPETFCVSLNMSGQIDPGKILKKFIYHHPTYTAASFKAQKRWNEISGKNGIHFAGAYWGYGFHEDGVTSGLRVAQALGEVL